MRRYQTLIGPRSRTSRRAVPRHGEQGQPVGPRRTGPARLGQGPAFDVKVLGQDVEKAVRRGVAVRVGCAGAYQDRAKQRPPGRSPSCSTPPRCPSPSSVTASVQPRLRTPCRQQAALPDPGRAERRDLRRFRRHPGRRHLRPLLQHHQNEYPERGTYQVVHHTQLLDRLVREKEPTPWPRPTRPPACRRRRTPPPPRAVTYRDPCYLGRHNSVYAPPREPSAPCPGGGAGDAAQRRQGVCCGAGGARMWMEEKSGRGSTPTAPTRPSPPAPRGSPSAALLR